MKVVKVKGIFCPSCGDIILEEDIPELFRIVDASLWQCGECEQVYANRGEAKACCKP